jgi:hypothetical protein
MVGQNLNTAAVQAAFLANIFNKPPPLQIGMNNLQHAKWPILREAA